MADSLTKEPLLSGLSDSPPQPDKMKAAKRRRYGRCKSAPPVDALPGPTKVHGLFEGSTSIFSHIHPSFLQVAIILAIYLGVSTVCFWIVTDQIKGMKTDSVLDAVYFCIVTMTTVGYGDLVPDGVASKLLACFFVFTGMAIGALILSKGADYLVEKQEVLIVRALHLHHKVGDIAIQKEIEMNRVKYKLLITTAVLLFLVVIGTIFLLEIEKLSLVDAFYCVCSTITTLGYGDKSFSTKGGRVFAIFWILTSTICMAQFFLYLAELNTERRQQLLVKWVLTRKMTSVDLEAADFDYDGNVGAAEFVIYKLKEMGKISQEDIALVMEEFEKLDVDQSGTLTTSDLALAQSSH